MNYLTILSLQFIHAYYSPGNEEPYRFELSQDCEKRMKYYAQVFRFNEQGFTILKDIDKIRPQADGTQNENYFFDVAVFPSDSYFFVYSDFEANFRERISYYIGSSKRLKKLNSADESIPFTLERMVSGKINENTEADKNNEIDIYRTVPVVLKPNKFAVTVEAKPGDRFTLIDKKENILNQWDVKEIKDGTTSFYIDVTQTVAGFLELERNGTVVSRYFADDRFFKSRPPILLGIGLSLDDLKEGSTFTRFEYRIRFNSRPVYWNYHVTAKGNGRKLENLEIINNNEKMLPGVTFPQAHIDREKNQVDFISDRPLPLVDKGYIDIELVDKESYGRPLISNLPNPDIRTVRFKENRWISDIFVYI